MLMAAIRSEETEFTIRTANQTLPLVRMIVEDIVELSDEVEETRRRLEYLSDGRNEDEQDEYSKELAAIREITKLKSEKVGSFISELTELSLVSDAVTDGFVDFPATREKEAIYLCWHLGEKEVMYWHRADEGCAKRRLIDLPLIRQSGDRNFSRPTS